jgi:hypothetical protein
MRISENGLRRIIRQLVIESASDEETINLSGVRIDNFVVSYDSEYHELYVDGAINNVKFEYESMSADYDEIAEQIVNQISDLGLFGNKSDSELVDIKKTLGQMILKKMF